MINSSELGFQYEHQFNLVPLDLNHYYLIDLTYSQFSNSEFSELNENGFQLVDDSAFKKYLENVCLEYKDVSLEYAYYKKSNLK